MAKKWIAVLEQQDRKRFQLLTGVNFDQLEVLMEAIVKPSPAKNKYSIN